MHVEISRDALRVRFGRRFALEDAQRLGETIESCGRMSRLDLDFSDVLDFEDAAVVPLAMTLGSLPDVNLRMQGLTMHQRRMLRYFGIDETVLASVH
jgi:hypothetical protein